MAETGDPEKPDDDGADRDGISSNPPTPVVAAPHDHDLDDLIGFTSPSALAGRERSGAVDAPPAEPEPEPDVVMAPEAEPEVEPQAEPITAPEEPVFVRPPAPTPPVVESVPEIEPEPDLFEPRPRPAYVAPPLEPAAPPIVPPAAVTPAWAIETPPPIPAADRKTFGRADTPSEPPEGAMGLYTIYALILFAVPTLGVSALIALFAITGRTEPQQALALSHHIYQKRSLWISAIAAALGVVLIAVNLGVFVLFVLALWVVVRGAAGVLALSANRPMKRPKSWLI